MRKITLLLFLSLISFFSYAEITEYTASNGVTYSIGDTLTLGRGSGINGTFVYCQMGDTYSALSALNGQYGGVSEGLSKTQAGANMIIKKIKEVKLKGARVITFSVAGGNIVRYKIFIEDAIQTGEVKSTGYTEDQALFELKKAKDKLDLELINQVQYDSIKSVLSKYIIK